MTSNHRLRDNALAIWKAGVAAAAPHRLLDQAMDRRGNQLLVCGRRHDLTSVRRIAVVGAGKAGAGMAEAVEQALGEDLLEEAVSGWVNVPADCVRPLRKIHLHAARPAAVNEPTVEGVRGAEQILEMVSRLTGDDLCLVLISGGGSALLPAPRPPITLEDKQAVTRLLMSSGASIQQLNAVRKRLSRIKGGGLARASRAGCLQALIISDVVGNPLDTIASGPTCPDTTTDAEALAVLQSFDSEPSRIPCRVMRHLRKAAAQNDAPTPFPDNVFNHIVGDNATALRAAADEARQRGYRVISLGSDNCGEANQVGRELAHRCRVLRDDPATELPVCLLSGGEPVVRLAETDRPRKGGRNQQLVLAGLELLKTEGMERIVLLSGGTDGEDGPTDAAGAVADEALLSSMRQQALDPRPFLKINDAYTFFEAVGGLIKTGPTHTNVMDLRIALIGA